VKQISPTDLLTCPFVRSPNVTIFNMPTPATLTVTNWNLLVPNLAKESDRGAAILAASFVENYLGSFLKSKTRNDRVTKNLFGTVGALSSFSQRIDVAYAFRFIEKHLYDDLTTIREVRNHFAHHPFDASFDDEKVQKLVGGMSMFRHFGYGPKNDARLRYRIPYLESCGMSCGALQVAMDDAASERSLDGMK
jgi:hypothetical protein